MVQPPRVSYLICSTPRSGSTLLTEALRGTGVTGRPDEYFLPSEQHLWKQQWGVTSAHEYLEAAVREGMTPNGVFGAKIMWDYFDDFIRFLKYANGIQNRNASATETISATFPETKFIWITRRDKIRQAISHSRAIQSNFWHDWKGNGRRPSTQPKEAVFRFSIVNELLQTIILQEACWGQFFADSNIVPLTIVYEDLVADYEGVTRKLATYLGLEVSTELNVLQARTRKQSDAKTEDWVRRYMRRRQLQRMIHLIAAVPLVLRNRYVLRRLAPKRSLHPRWMFERDQSGSE